MHVFTAPECALHEPGVGHPEAPARLLAVLQALSATPDIHVTLSEKAPLEPLLLCHDRRYLEQVAALSSRGGGSLDEDTHLSPRSWDAALLAAGAALAALEHALAGRGNSFAAIRPPGHHALRERAMGFCLINQVAVLAAVAHREGRQRVLIVDWDVHHGNGTQALVERDSATRFVSMHQAPWWPGTGAASERGMGNCFNLPVAAGLEPSVYLETLWGGIVAATRDWAPDLVLVSAGYDGMLGDPLGGLTLEPEHYAEWTHRLRERYPAAPIVGLMEGGYAPDRLAAGVLATVKALG